MLNYIVWILLSAAQCYNSGPSHCVREFPQAHGQWAETTQRMSGRLDMDRAAHVWFNHSSFPPRNGTLLLETLVRIPGQTKFSFDIQFVRNRFSSTFAPSQRFILLQCMQLIDWRRGYMPFACEYFLHRDGDWMQLAESILRIMMLAVCHWKERAAERSIKSYANCTTFMLCGSACEPVFSAVGTCCARIVSYFYSWSSRNFLSVTRSDILTLTYIKY